MATYKNRCIGVCTGSRSAAAAGRIPLLDVASRRMSTWVPNCLTQNGCSFALATFVDNLISTGSTPEGAIKILEDCAEELASHWQLSIGQESKEFIVCRGYQRDIDVPCHWQQRYTFKTLGHHIDDDAGIAGCFQHTTAAMIRSFYGNLNNGLR